MKFFRIFGDYYTMYCFGVGIFYTGVGCVLLSAYGLNTHKWWKGYTCWYIAYILLTLLNIETIGSLILDVWLAPLLWLGELELVHWIQKSLGKR